MSTRARRPSASSRAASVARHSHDEGKERRTDGHQSTPAPWASPLRVFSNLKGAFDDEWSVQDSARAYRRGRGGDVDVDGSPSKTKRASPPSRAREGEFMDAIDDAIDAAIGATVSSMSVVGEWLGVSAPRRAKKDDDDADEYSSAARTRRVAFSPTSEKENARETPPLKKDARDMARELEETRAELAGARAREQDATRKYEALKKQNLALQKRQVARETKREETSETMTVVEQLKAQVEALMSEKASMARDINALTRENKDMRAFMVCNGLIASDDENEEEERDGVNAVSDEGDISTASSDIDALSLMDREALEREIAELEASLSASSSPADKQRRSDATM